MAKWTEHDRKMMRRALELAATRRGFVEPNPMVGCVIVRAGRVVGEGCHRRFGGPHAEVNALSKARGKAKGATAYVTLEPCAHHGKTPPCVDALVRAGIQRCVIAMRDPNPLVAGRGIRALRAAGIRVESGLLGPDARRLVAPFIVYHTQARPHVTLKWAQSLDGKIATISGDSKWITSLASRRRAHALRARVDAVVVGIGTVLADDPDLTARLAKPKRVATRIVLDGSLRIPQSAKLVRSARKVPTIIATSQKRGGRSRRRAALERAGVEVLSLPEFAGAVDIEALLHALREREMTNVMVEGGGRVLGTFLNRGLADAAEVYVAPRLIGGSSDAGPLTAYEPRTMADLIGITSVSRTDCGPDLCYNLLLGG